MKQAQNARQQRGRPSSRQGGKSNRGSGNHRNEQKSRGNPKQLVDKYQNQARECLQAGDRMQAEYYFQFAEHYYRVLNENRNNNPNQGDRDGQQNNGRRPHAQSGDNSGNDGPQGGRNQRRGRRGRPQDDRQNGQNDTAQANSDQSKQPVQPEHTGHSEHSEQANGAAANGASAAPSANEVSTPAVNSEVTAEVTADQKTEGNAPKPDVQQDNAPTLDLNGDAAKPAKKRAPRKRSVPKEKLAAKPEEKLATEPVLNPAVSDLS